MWAYDADAAKMWIGRNGTWYFSGDPAAGTNAGFQNMPTSGAYFKTAYATSGNGSMTFEILNDKTPKATKLIHSLIILMLSGDKRVIILL